MTPLQTENWSRTPFFSSLLDEGYILDSNKQLQFRFSKAAQMPIVSALFVASGSCTGMTTNKVWSYTLTELNGITKVTVQPVWEYPDDYCKTQTQELIWSQREEIAAFQAMLDKAPAASVQKPTSNPIPTSPAVGPAASPESVANHQ